jgi:hypothetical protein
MKSGKCLQRVALGGVHCITVPRLKEGALDQPRKDGALDQLVELHTNVVAR